MLQCKTIYPNKTLLSFSDKSIYYLMVEKMLLLWLNSKACGEHFTILGGQLSEVLVTSCLCPTFPVNGLVFFCFLLCGRSWLCCCGWITKLEGRVSLPYLIGNRQISYSYISALIFGWMDVMPFLKRNGSNKRPIIIYIDFQVTISKWWIVNAPKSLKLIYFWNSPELSSWTFKRTFLSFLFFYKLSFNFAFPTSVSWFHWREDLTWSWKDFEIGKIWDLLNVKYFDHK